ncbi:type IV secretory system conjugative DNA transfer family protein, partial [Phocaeicola vulgatus]|nr:type IV secretory system conjugative DNA transfer family protein [Phocaeicola vulgatus]MCB6281536.1 type IV secretory system conjugative DNA transfer family protein [Phocaeicola vulgatus]MCB6293733.1 type IV secretory system conjugative DNA transfer family protein [Phocaeicola vulgatus]MCB6327490.1 type IV secretory system conjugative DNA transfer family protein [Phocaeicola vulgatus]MCB6451142.1 type IV secretory system conjugative DNA transfer family protein [Phocaeicola vulgatus]
WYTGALGILNGVAYRLWDEFPECCTLPHIFNFVMKADTEQLQEFLKLNDISAMMAEAYLKAEGSEKTQASYVST